VAVVRPRKDGITLSAPDTRLDELIVCPACDAVWRVTEPEAGGVASCARCHHVLIRPRAGAILQIVALSLAVLVLLVGALFLPFIAISARGLSHASSIFEVALAFAGQDFAWLSILVVGFIIGVPMSRVLLLLYALGPLIAGRRALGGAGQAFRWADDLRPWSMAEIFILGVGVSLVKIVDLARVEIGPAFWMFALLVLITLLQDTLMCRWTVWRALDEGGAGHDLRGRARAMRRARAAQ
jgi:paraquat-inducible protein A